MKTRYSISLVATLFFVTISVFAATGPKYRGFEVEGAGRSGTASVLGEPALFLNPAGLANLKGNGFEMSINWGLNGVLLDYADWAAKNYRYVSQIDSLLSKMEPVQNKWAPFSNSLVMQGHYQDFAFALVNDIRYDLALAKAVITPVMGAGMVSDIQFIAGRGFTPARLPDWRLGFSVKYLYRLRFQNRLLGTTDQPFYTVVNEIKKPANSLLDNIAKIGVAAKIADPGLGFGVNLGAMRTLPNGFTAGVSFLDFPTFYDGGFMYPQMNLGGGYARDFDVLQGMNHRVIANLDWQIPFSWEPWYKQWKMGAAVEGRLGSRLISVVALGLNDGYPSFALKLGYVLNLSYLYIADEQGTYPGQRKLSFHKIGIDLSF